MLNVGILRQCLSGKTQTPQDPEWRIDRGCGQSQGRKNQDGRAGEVNARCPEGEQGSPNVDKCVYDLGKPTWNNRSILC